MDVEAFIDLINDPPDSVAGFFDPSADIFVARAPGRLDVMGGIADYSGSLVMPMPIAEATFAAVQKSPDSLIEIVSLAADDVTARRFVMSISDLGLAAGGYAMKPSGVGSVRKIIGLRTSLEFSLFCILSLDLISKPAYEFSSIQMSLSEKASVRQRPSR